MSNFKSMTQRINKAVTLDDLKKLDVSLGRVFNVGAISASEFWKLDDMILNKIFKLEGSVIEKWMP